MTIGIVGCGNLGFSLLNGIRLKDENVKIIASKRSIKEFEHLYIGFRILLYALKYIA